MNKYRQWRVRWGSVHRRLEGKRRQSKVWITLRELSWVTRYLEVKPLGLPWRNWIGTWQARRVSGPQEKAAFRTFLSPDQAMSRNKITVSHTSLSSVQGTGEAADSLTAAGIPPSMAMISLHTWSCCITTSTNPYTPAHLRLLCRVSSLTTSLFLVLQEKVMEICSPRATVKFRNR